MSKQTAYEEMCKKLPDTSGKHKGKYVFSFDEIADIAERHLGKRKEDVISLLNKLGKEQK